MKPHITQPRRSTVWRVLCAFLSAVHIAEAQPATEEDSDSQLRAGLYAEITGAAGAQVSRVDAALSFDWKDGTPDRRLKGDKFHAVWTGRLWIPVPGSYRVSGFAIGRVKLFVNGEQVERCDVQAGDLICFAKAEYQVEVVADEGTE